MCATSSDWLIGLSAPVLIGQSNYFSFDFTTLHGETALSIKLLHFRS